jgi:Avidin family
MANLSGTWYNQLGSRMDLTTDNCGGLSGTYKSAVGDAPVPYCLAGRFYMTPLSGRNGVTLGWAVTFGTAQSTATWSGQYFGGGSIAETIVTHWLLTTSTGEAPTSIWKSTRVGHDTFTRIPPNVSAEIAEALALTVDSQDPDDILSQFFHFVRPASHPFFSDIGFNSFLIIQNC